MKKEFLQNKRCLYGFLKLKQSVKIFKDKFQTLFWGNGIIDRYDTVRTTVGQRHERVLIAWLPFPFTHAHDQLIRYVGTL